MDDVRGPAPALVHTLSNERGPIHGSGAAARVGSFSESSPSRLRAGSTLGDTHQRARAASDSFVGHPGDAVADHDDSVLSNHSQLNHGAQRRFESSAVNMEYSTLSSILRGNSVPDLTSATSPTFSDDSSRTESMYPPTAGTSTGSGSANEFLNQYVLGSPSTNLIDFLSTVDVHANPTGEYESQKPRPISFAITDLTQQPVAPLSQDIHVPEPIAAYTQTNFRPTKPREIYINVRTPFPYTPGFHALIRYLRSRFNRQQLMKIVRSMARYRPSYIACTNSLDEDDLIFMEQCFQRTLLEYEKYISYSGTPTVVWRRTGQIAAVGKEFTVLTGWSRDQLLADTHGTGAGMFIVELMDDESVVEYFETFSDMAFGDSTGATMSECTLRTPSGRTLKTSSILTVKRDVFGIPMMIIGNFLPILPT